MGDALTKGTGTPWGPTQFGLPSTPQYQNYETDINKFMDAPEIRQAIEAMNLKGGDLSRQYMAQQSKMLGSGTTSGSNAGRLANIAAQTEKNRNFATSQLAGQRMDAFNRAREAKNRLMQGQYGTELEAYGREQESRGGAIGDLLQGAATLGGSWLGRKK